MVGVCGAAFLLILGPASLEARVEDPRLVLIKLDGLPALVLEAAIEPEGPASERLPHPDLFREAHRYSRSVQGRDILLPNLETYFFRQGARPQTLFTTTLPVSSPSWAVIDTGQPSIVKNNYYFNRSSGELHFYLDQFRESRDTLARGAGKTTALWQLDLLGVPLMLDAFPPERTFTSIQTLYRRRPGDQLSHLGAQVITAGEAPKNPVRVARRHLSHTVYHPGFPGITEDSLAELTVQKILEKGPDGEDVYDVLSVIFPLMDHEFHVDADYRNILSSLVVLDNWIGRILDAVLESGRRDRTLVALVSDHGLDFDPVRVSYSFPITRWLRNPLFGNHTTLVAQAEDYHHALTVPIQGIDFARVYESEASPYGPRVPFGEKGYYTAFTANNGNPRFDAFLRNSDLNRLHLLFLEVLRVRGDEEQLKKIYAVFQATLAEARPWLEEELEATLSAVVALERYAASLARRGDAASKDSEGRLRRESAGYRKVASALHALLSLSREWSEWLVWARGEFRIPDLIPKGYLGRPNTLQQLRGYVTGWKETPDQRWRGGEAKFRRLDYSLLFPSFRASSPDAYGNRFPFQFFSFRLPAEEVEHDWGRSLRQLIWLSFREDRGQVLIAESTAGDFFYLPVRELRRQGSRYRFEMDENGDPLLAPALVGRWISPREWAAENASGELAVLPVILADLFRDNYEAFLEDPVLRRRLVAGDAKMDVTAHLNALRYRYRQQEPDFRVWVNRGWNVNVHSHTPGGTHGAFHPLETLAVFAVWAGKEFPLKRGQAIPGAYFTQDIAPTLLDAMGTLGEGGSVIPRLGASQYTEFPRLSGTVIPVLNHPPHPSLP